MSTEVNIETSSEPVTQKPVYPQQGSPLQGEGASWFLRVARSIGILILGLIVPAFVLIQAYVALGGLSENVNVITRTTAQQQLARTAPFLHSGNDYALFSMLAEEKSNEAIVVNKQMMKIVTMQIGFSLMSLGLMLVTLGFNEGGADISGAWSTIKFDFRTGSSGVLVFVIGGAMAAAGGLLKNDYKTVPIPEFVAQMQSPLTNEMRIYVACRKRLPNTYKECFTNSFEASVSGGLR